ncbi:MAG: GNAT family N-acetyltransferase [Bdellovibrionales bacterium]|nr:GNAT family N-acetyltransferase [Bdellovibrionales bacterium]
MITALEKKPFANSLKGPRLWLEKATTAHAEKLWECVLKDRELRGVSWPGTESVEEMRGYLQMVDLELPKDEVVYIMRLEQEIIGSFHIHSLNYTYHRTEIGYGIQKAYEGYGFVSEAVELVEKELKRLGFNRIEIRCNADNIRSVSLAKRNAYRHEGTLLQECVEDGRFRDTAIFAKLLRS